jgi:hypothetical protein
MKPYKKTKTNYKPINDLEIGDEYSSPEACGCKYVILKVYKDYMDKGWNAFISVSSVICKKCIQFSKYDSTYLNRHKKPFLLTPLHPEEYKVINSLRFPKEWENIDFEITKKESPNSQKLKYFIDTIDSRR